MKRETRQTRAEEAEWSPLAALARPGGRGPLARFGLASADLILLGLFFCVVAWFCWRVSRLPEYHWQWPLLGEFLLRRDGSGGWEAGLLLRGLGVTIRLGVWSMLLALLSGGLLGLASARKHGLAAFPAQAYVNLVRNTPPLVLLFLIYFFAGNLVPVSALEQAIRGLPAGAQSLIATAFAPPGQMDRMLAAVLTLGLYEGAYVAEIVRGGVEGVPAGQWEASAALGFPRFAQLRLIILPQAMRTILPPLAGQTISAFKDSALASLISLPELTFQSLEVMAVSRMTFEIWISAGFLYLVLGVACARFSRYLETRRSWQR